MLLSVELNGENGGIDCTRHSFRYLKNGTKQEAHYFSSIQAPIFEFI